MKWKKVFHSPPCLCFPSPPSRNFEMGIRLFTVLVVDQLELTWNLVRGCSSQQMGNASKNPWFSVQLLLRFQWQKHKLAEERTKTIFTAAPSGFVTHEPAACHLVASTVPYKHIPSLTLPLHPHIQHPSRRLPAQPSLAPWILTVSDKNTHPFIFCGKVVTTLLLKVLLYQVLVQASRQSLKTQRFNFLCYRMYLTSVPGSVYEKGRRTPQVKLRRRDHCCSPEDLPLWQLWKPSPRRTGAGLGRLQGR